MLLGILTLITALCISAVAIYYSVAGLVAIFAAAATPIMIMGGVLEVSKLVTAVWLHRYWKQATWWLKAYLTTAVVVLMLITSMGIFGFLSKAHIEQTAAADEGIAQIERIDDELMRQGAIIDRAEQRIEEAEASVGESNADIQAQIDKEQTRIDTAYDRIQPAIDEQNAIIQTQLDSLEDRVAVYEEEIKSLDNELERLNNLVAQFRSELENTTVASIEAQVKPYNEQIAKLDEDLDRINTQANEYEARISELQIDTSAIEALKTRIESVEESIVLTTNKLQSTERAKIQEGQAVIGVTSDGLFGGNTRRALATWVEAQQDRIAQLQAQETELRTQAQTTLDAERQRLTDQVKDLRGPQTETILQRKQGLLDAVDQIRSNSIDEAKTAKATIQSKIDAVLNTDIPANRSARQTAQEQITALRQAEDTRINAARQSIKDLRAGADAQILASNELIQRLRNSLTVGKDEAVEKLVEEQQNKIIQANNTIDNLTEQKYKLQAEYRKLEAEVGPVKYIAEFVYGEQAGKDLLEEAVRWVILIIIFVFDPLAVLLLIASQYTFEILRKRKDDQKELHRRNELKDYERQRAQKIIDNPGFFIDTPAPSEEEVNDNESNDNKHVEHAPGSEDRESTGSNSAGKEDRESTNTNANLHEDIGAGDIRRSNSSELFQPRGGLDNANNGTVQESEVQTDDNQVEETKKKDIELSEESNSVDPLRKIEWDVKEKDKNFNAAKTAWKAEHPNETIKLYKTLFLKGKINSLPWESNDYQPKQEPENNQEGYIQNSEQNENTLFNRLKNESKN
jgi:peptidoglycan hydrolase CwlO-like protein